MGAGAATAAPSPVEVRRIVGPAEFTAVEDVVREAWGIGTGPVVPSSLQRALQDNGGLVLGAFEGPRMVGIALGFLGREGSDLFHYSHMTAVRPDARGRHIGRAIKLAQRDEVLRTGLSEIRWTFDPLQSRNAHFNVRVLGGVPDRYHIRYYGPMRDSVNAGLETDRVRLVWRLNDPGVVRRAQGLLPSCEEDERRWRTAEPLIESAPESEGTRRPVRVRTASSPHVQVEIPHDLDALRSANPESLRAWREATRAALDGAIAGGYRVEDFLVRAEGPTSRSFYLLSRAAGTG